LKQLPERGLFIRALRSWVGFKQTGIEYDRPERKAGKSKYSLRRLYALATDGIVALSLRPLQLTQFVSVLYMIVACCIVAIMLYRLAAGLIVDFVLWLVLLIILLSFCAFTFLAHMLGEAISRPRSVMLTLYANGCNFLEMWGYPMKKSIAENAQRFPSHFV
jgi:hypothetical protein